MSDEDERPSPEAMDNDGADGKPGFKITLSKYDAERQKKAILKRKEQFYSETGILGRKLDGFAFEATPRIIEFKDFSLNEPHLLTIEMTNISPASNYFKILPIEDEFRVDTT